MRLIHPIEFVGLCAAAICFFCVLVLGMSWYMPSGHSALFSTRHYLLPLLFALALALFGQRNKNTSVFFADLLIACRVAFAFIWVVLFHFNFKLWAQLLNPLRWDDVLILGDAWLADRLPLLDSLQALSGRLQFFWPSAYHDVFVAMFFVSLAGHAVFSPGLRRLSEVMTAVAAVLLIGGVAYAVMPAWGPFIYAPGTNELATYIQQQMAGFQADFVASGGSRYRGENFVMALGAMPSLHTSHAFVLLYFAWKYTRWLGLVYLPLCVFILSEAVAAKWHYALDLPAGMVVAWASIWLAGFLHRGYLRKADA